MMSKQAKAKEKRENDGDSSRYAKDARAVRYPRRCDQQPNIILAFRKKIQHLQEAFKNASHKGGNVCKSY